MLTDSPTNRVPSAAVGAVAVGIGLVAWVTTNASKPRYSYGAEQHTPSIEFMWVLLAAALLGGFVFPRRAVLVAFGLGLPPLLLSPWTAPRGDNDGLWLMIVPILFVCLFVILAAGGLGAWVRGRLTSLDSVP